MTDELVFRGMRGRTLDDQARAMSDGYNSVAEMALDELGAIVLDLRARVEALEQRPTQAEQLHTITNVWDAARQDDSEGKQ